MKNKCIAIIQKKIMMKIIIWWVLLQKFDANLKRLSWNCFGESKRESDSQTRVVFQNLVSKINFSANMRVIYFSNDF